MKRLVYSCAFIGAAVSGAALLPAQAEASQALSVKVQVNDDIVQFTDAQPFIDKNGNLQVPLRAVTDKLGYEVKWAKQGGEVAVSVLTKDQVVSLRTDEQQALVGSKKISLESSPAFIQGSTYVPLRFITETFGSKIEWSDANQIAIVNADGKPHKPAWTAPPEPPAPAPAPAPPQPSMTDLIVQTASNYMGVPYKWGGTTPRGFDCSGLVGYVFEAEGIDLPRTSAELYSDAGTPVSDLKVGDLVFFGRGVVDHVGIYLGNDQFISSTSSRGVAVESLSSKYWGARYVGAKRII